MEKPVAESVDLETFLQRLERSETKLELIGGAVFAFAGGSVAHADLCSRINALVRSKASVGCRTFTSDMALAVSRTGSYVFPDTTHTCERIDVDATAIVAPTLVAEVISPDSVRRDRIEKLDLYQSISSVQEYAIVDSRTRWITIFRRAGTLWQQQVYEAKDDVVAFVSVPLTFTLDELYREIR